MPPRTLSGRTVLVTRPEGPDGPLTTVLRSLGAEVVHAPVLRIAPPASWARLDAALRRLPRYDAAVFASRNAVASVFSRGRALGLRLVPPAEVFAVGPATARALRRRGWPAAQPRRHRAEALADLMGEVSGRRIFLPRAARGREVLPRILRRRGARVDAVTAYRTLPDRRSRDRIRRAARSGDIAAVAFTSGSSVHNFLEQLPGALRRRLFRTAAAAVIGPVAGEALRRWGLRPDIEAPRATLAALGRAIARHYER